MNRGAAVVPSVGEIDPAGWLDRFDDMFTLVVAPAFVRREPRLRARWYLLGLASGLERKNGWTLAEFAGDASPDGMQRLICLTVNEIRRMHAILSRPAHPAAHHLHWSRWRRRHQARARHCHYQRHRERH